MTEFRHLNSAQLGGFCEFLGAQLKFIILLHTRFFLFITYNESAWICNEGLYSLQCFQSLFWQSKFLPETRYNIFAIHAVFQNTSSSPRLLVLEEVIYLICYFQTGEREYLKIAKFLATKFCKQRGNKLSRVIQLVNRQLPPNHLLKK